uniref:MADF domain-containing protein n=1 Tax=Caenorhabditis japonica TaxID=281687 RepID=A0A8R1I6X6_CAEJA
MDDEIEIVEKEELLVGPKRGRKKKPTATSGYESYEKEDMIFFISLVEQARSLWDSKNKCYHRSEIRLSSFDSIEEECKSFMPRGKIHEPGPEKDKNGCSNRRVCMVINDYLSKLSELEAVKAEARIIDLVDKMSNSAISFNGAEIPSPMTSTRNYPSSFDVPFHFDDFDDV